MLRLFVVCIEMARPHNMLAAALCVAAGHHVAGGGAARVAVAASILAALATGAGNVINDYFDLEIDRRNKPRRPLPSGRISPRAARWLYAVMSVLVLGGAALFLPARIAALVVVWQASLFVYAARLKRVFVAGNLLVAAITSSAFFAGGMAAGRPSESVVPFLIAFFFVLSREVVKGAEDVEGDRESQVRTLAVVAGVEPAAKTATVMMTTVAVLIPVPALLGYYGGFYFWTMDVLVIPPLLIGAHMVLRKAARRTFNRVSWMLKIAMFFGILAVALGRS